MNIRSSIFTIAVSFLFLLVQGKGFADDSYYAMIVRGGPGVTTSYADGVLTVTIRKAHIAAGDRLNYGQLPIGSAAWVDRPLNAAEPFYLEQKIVPAQAQAIMGCLGNSNGYWKFFCRYNEQGYFDVARSERTSPAVRID